MPNVNQPLTAVEIIDLNNLLHRAVSGRQLVIVNEFDRRVTIDQVAFDDRAMLVNLRGPA